MEESNKGYHCEDCKEFDEEEIPANCIKGHGKVSFRHPVCSDFKVNDKINYEEEQGQ